MEPILLVDAEKHVEQALDELLPGRADDCRALSVAIECLVVSAILNWLRNAIAENPDSEVLGDLARSLLRDGRASDGA